MVGYIYLVTNLINNKKYIGKRQKDKFQGRKYLGSGTYLKAARKIYGDENFSIEVIEEVDGTPKDLSEREKYYISKYNAASDPMYYNISLGGDGAHLLYQTPETRRKISEANKGRKRTDEARALMSSQRKASKWFNNGEEQHLVRLSDIPRYIEAGWHVGQLPGQHRRRNPETNLKIKYALKGKRKSATHLQNLIDAKRTSHRHWYTNGIVNKSIKESETIPEGFHPGRVIREEAIRKNSESHKGRTPWNKGLRKSDIQKDKLGELMENPYDSDNRMDNHDPSRCKAEGATTIESIA